MDRHEIETYQGTDGLWYWRLVAGNGRVICNVGWSVKARTRRASDVRLRPLADVVIVEPEAEEQTLSSGLVRPESFADRGRPRIGVVIAVGRGYTMPNSPWGVVPLQVNVGNRVYFLHMAGEEFEFPNGSKCRIMHEADILAVIE